MTDSTEKRRRPLHHWQVTTPRVVAGTAAHLLSKAPFAELKHDLTYQPVPIVPEKLP